MAFARCLLILQAEALPAYTTNLMKHRSVLLCKSCLCCNSDEDEVDFEGFLRILRVDSTDSLDNLDQYDARLPRPMSSDMLAGLGGKLGDDSMRRSNLLAGIPEEK